MTQHLTQVLSLKRKIADFEGETKRHGSDSIIDMYRYYNTQEWSLKNHGLYLSMNSINTNGRYEGSVLVAKWYERNLKIFSNIQNLCKDCQRVFVVYGAGHLQILRDFINSCDDLALTDVEKYL